jgi:propionate catabolism operon transcriptional regulator
VALFLAAEPLQALSPGFVMTVAPELTGKSTAADPPFPVLGFAPAPPPETAAQVLARFGGNRAAAASHMGISRTTLWRKLRQGN